MENGKNIYGDIMDDKYELYDNKFNSIIEEYFKTFSVKNRAYKGSFFSKDFEFAFFDCYRKWDRIYSIYKDIKALTPQQLKEYFCAQEIDGNSEGLKEQIRDLVIFLIMMRIYIEDNYLK